jgi:RNA polymerase sigma factor (sigma-70 family)
VTTPDDAALVRAAQAGDHASLGALLERHRALLLAAAVGMLGHGPQAEDAVHDTFLVALRRIGDVREPAAARAWLLAIVGNVCRAQLRRPVVEVAAAEPVEPPAADTVEAAIERTALRDWVWTALDRLSPPLRLAVVLRYFSNASSYEAIAELCGVPVGTVRSRLHSAKAQLADELLQSAAESHAETEAYRRFAVAAGTAMREFERSGDQRVLRGFYAPDVSFRMADRVERQGLDLFASLLAADFEDGVRARLMNAVAGADVAVVELWLDSPPEQPLHCPPAATQVHFHDGRATNRIVSYYAQRP